MSVNKLMHPRNIYKTPPNFKQMAIDYPEFRKYVKQDITGKIRIDFKDNETLRCLTQTLLKKDFDLDVNIPLDRLIPTVPLRLNYILWLEDLLTLFEDKAVENVHGVDIGTGASCIYPLLAARKNKWKMLATEIDEQSIQIAQENIHRNNVQHLITIKQNTSETILKQVLEPNVVYDFCMCNPPFFSSTNELDPFAKSRSDNRTLPRNAPSGVLGEVVAKGGEVQFISQIIKESVEIKSQIKIFTTMIGHKSSLAALKVILRAVDVSSFKQTEFHQGNTTRWALSWTFADIDLRKIPQETVHGPKKKSKPPQKFILPKTYQTLEEVVVKARSLFQTLQMTYEEIKKNKFMYAFQVTAQHNTWSHQRRKRRQQQRTQQNTSSTENDSIVSETNEQQDSSMDTSTESPTHKRLREDSDEEDFCNVKKLRIQEEGMYLKFNCIVRKLSDEFHLEMCYIDGTAGRDCVHQIMQYFKNNFK